MRNPGQVTSARALRHAWLTEQIRQIRGQFRGVYGYRRMHAELTLGHGVSVGAEAVALLMRRAGLAGVTGRPKFRRIPNQPTARDHVERDFSRENPDRLWVTDITEHPTREGEVYCAVVLDTFSRRVVGWSIDSSPNAALVTNAPGMALSQRTPTDATVIHADQGTQFTSWTFTRRALDSGLVPSMGSKGDCYDNAMIESFWARMQVEFLERKRWNTRVKLANEILLYRSANPRPEASSRKARMPARCRFRVTQSRTSSEKLCYNLPARENRVQPIGGFFIVSANTISDSGVDLRRCSTGRCSDSCKCNAVPTA